MRIYYYTEHVWVLSDIYEVYRDGLVSFLLGLALGYQDI